MSDISKRIADLPPEKRALLAQRLKKRPPLKTPQTAAARDAIPVARDASIAAPEVAPRRPRRRPNGQIDFSIFFFTGDGASESDRKYRLVLESARFADRHGFTAIWTPERHFHSFGGLYSNPSVMSAALAMVTERLQLRAGSVVFPLHHPVRVAEEWSIVDNLSRGRIGLAFASGWHPNDFVFAADRFPRRREETWEGFATFRKLWSGARVEYPSGTGEKTAITLFPKPITEDVPLWLTTGGSAESFVKAGELGVSVLTHLLGQDLETLETNVALYHDALERHGHSPHDHCVTVMVHTFLGKDPDAVRETVRDPFCNYLKTFTGLLDNLAKSFKLNISHDSLTAADWEVLLSHAFERYSNGLALFGTPTSCLDLVHRLREIGVGEVGCLIDFGVEEDLVLESLRHLDELRREANDEDGKAEGVGGEDRA